MKNKILLLLLLSPFLLKAQDKGIHFEHGISWADVRAKAKKENKYIFMDCFTTWCGPCRYMSANIFPQEVMGNYFNEKFVSIKVQLDTTDADNEEVKNWYKDGAEIAKAYSINAYPTFLVFNPDGKAVHRIVGGGEPEEFISRIQNAFDTDKQYYTLLDKYNSGNKEPAFLKTMAEAALDGYDLKNAENIAKEYQATQKDLFTKENLLFISRFMNSSEDENFKIFIDNREKVIAAIGKQDYDNKMTGIIMQEEVYPIVYAWGDEAPKTTIEELSASLKEKYPRFAEQILITAKPLYYQKEKDWPKFKTAVDEYIKYNDGKVIPDMLNNFAWSVFLDCNDMACVQQALAWSKKSFADSSNPMFMDTYANILYKLGKKDEAISWEQKALQLAADADKKGYQETINKMKAGEKTWN